MLQICIPANYASINYIATLIKKCIIRIYAQVALALHLEFYSF